MVSSVSPERLGRLLKTSVIDLTAIGGGDICLAYRAELGDGRTVFVKSRTDAPTGFFATESRGLQALGAVDSGVRVPDVLGVDDDGLVLEWVDTGPPTPAAAERFGRALARTHSSGAAEFGSSAGDGWIGRLALPGGPWPNWTQMWAEGRLLPYLRTARSVGAISGSDAREVATVIAELPRLAGPPEPAALIHGDLWAGNVLWGADGVNWIVDPAAHGGHRETDLAMLALFGLPHLEHVLGAYREVSPLADGWRQRVALHQLHPVLVHAVLFGGSYGARAGHLARAVLRED